MIKVTNISVESYGEKTIAMVNLRADTSDEVIAIGDDATSVIGLGSKYTMSFGSLALCADGKVLMLNSEGEWK